jgi:hypothetical protein
VGATLETDVLGAGEGVTVVEQMHQVSSSSLSLLADASFDFRRIY